MFVNAHTSLRHVIGQFMRNISSASFHKAELMQVSMDDVCGWPNLADGVRVIALGFYSAFSSKISFTTTEGFLVLV